MFKSITCQNDQKKVYLNSKAITCLEQVIKDLLRGVI